MRYRKDYIILSMDGDVIGFRATRSKAIELGLRLAQRRKASIEVMRRTEHGYKSITTCLNPVKFVTPGDGIEWIGGVPDN